MSSQQQKESPTDAFLRDVSTWKLAGVAVWHAGLFLLGAAVWTLPPSTSAGTLASALFSSSWFYLLVVYASLAGVLYAQRRVLTTIDVPPLYVAQLGWSSKAWPALLLSRYGGFGGPGRQRHHRTWHQCAAAATAWSDPPLLLVLLQVCAASAQPGQSRGRAAVLRSLPGVCHRGAAAAAAGRQLESRCVQLCVELLPACRIWWGMIAEQGAAS